MVARTGVRPAEPCWDDEFGDSKGRSGQPREYPHGDRQRAKAQKECADDGEALNGRVGARKRSSNQGWWARLGKVVPDCAASGVGAPLHEPVDNAPQGSMIGASEMMIE